MAGCYRVRVCLDGHHFELVIVADDEANAAAKAHKVLTDKRLRANTTYWPGDGAMPVVRSVTFEHDRASHGSRDERRLMAAWRRALR